MAFVQCRLRRRDRRKSLSLGRTQTLGIGAQPYAISGYGFRDILNKGMEPFLELCDKIYGLYMTPSARTRLAANDLAALIAASSIERPDLSDVLPSMKMPCLLLTGALDPICANVQKAATLLPTAELVVLPDCDHVGNFARTELVLLPISAFLARVGAAS